MSTTAPPLNDLVTKIRGAHPGAYDDMDDATLTKKVLAKYPQYSDLAAPKLMVGKQPEELKPDSEQQAEIPSTTTGFEASGQVAPKSDVETGLRNQALGTGAVLGAGIGIPALGPEAASIAGTAVRPIARLAAKHPIITSMAIGSARHIPYVGKLVPPYAEMLPFLRGAGGETPPEAPPAETSIPRGEVLPPDVYRPGYRAPRSYYGGQPVEPIPVRRGLMLQGETAPPVATPEPPSPVVPRAITPKEIGTKLNEGLGNKPVVVRPGVSMRNQFKPETPPAPVAEGHTAVQSSAVKSFKYDPEAQELHVTAKDGGTHVYGEVTPAQAEAFKNADSKGLAWKAIRDNNPKVAKINSEGTRTANKGATEFKVATPEDLTPILERSLANAKKKP